MAYQLILCILFAQLTLNVYAKVPAVIVFGDSSVDAGNNNHISTILKSNFKPYGRDFIGAKPTGRFSNGKVPTDFISEAFKLKPTVPAYLDPAYNITDFATGVCFASAGTGYDNATSRVLSVIPLWKEIQYYKEYQTRMRDFLGLNKANEVLTESLYLLSLGTNDFLENYYAIPGKSLRYPVYQFEDYLIGLVRNFIIELYQLGARKMSLGGLPPMGCLPLERSRKMLLGRTCVEEYNDVAKEFNGKLQELIVSLNKELRGLRLVLSNPYDILLEIIQQPKSFGFENSARACCATGTFEMGYTCDKFNPFTCRDANKYVFWDSFHPTDKTNGIVAKHVVEKCLAEFL